MYGFETLTTLRINWGEFMQYMFPQFEQHVSRKVRTQVRASAKRRIDHGLKNRREVHESGKPRHTRDEQRILDLLAQRSATRHEISIALQMAYTTVSARVAGLKRKCFVRDTKTKRPTATGTPACVVELVSRG